MPIEPFELLKLIGGIVILTIPGYLWSFLFSKQLTYLERLVFGFVLGLGILACGVFVISVLFNIRITQTFVLALFALYATPVFILYGLSIYRFGLPKINLKPLKNKKFILLVIILGFSFFMTFLPHLLNNYFLPFHVDEWIHWSYTRSVMQSSSATFLNPYTGGGPVVDLEIGFRIATACLKWISGSNLLTILVFMPAIIAVFVSLTAFNIGERTNRKFGLESAFLVAFIPTTCRFLGPSFYVAITLGLLFLIFIIWLGKLKKIQGTLLLSGILWCMFIIHPPTALAGIIIMFIYSAFLAIEKEYKIAVLISLFTVMPLIIVYYLTARWELAINMLMEAIHGKEELLWLPKIWIDFEHLGVLTLALFVIGVYFSFFRGKALARTLSFSSIAFILIIGIYDNLGYGVPIVYERTFLYLLLLITLVAGIGLSELRKTISDLAKNKRYKRYKQNLKNLQIAVPISICIVILLIAVPAHTQIGYYQMINEQDYETCVWIRDNIDDYRDANHSYDKAAVHPFKASPFSAITGLHIVSLSMYPIYGYRFHTQMESFLQNKCVDTEFLERHGISVVYGDCENENLTMIYPNVYLYPGLYE